MIYKDLDLGAWDTKCCYFAIICYVSTLQH